MKTAKMIQDFNWLCNLDVNHKLLHIFMIKVVYLCTLHNNQPLPLRCLRVVAANAHLVQQYKCLNPGFFPRINADFLIVMVRYSVSTFSNQLANKFDLCSGCKALISRHLDARWATLANSHTSTSQQGKYLTFDKTYIRQREKFQLGLLPVLPSPSRPFHREEAYNYIFVT